MNAAKLFLRNRWRGSRVCRLWGSSVLCWWCCRWSEVAGRKRWTVTAPQQNSHLIITLICQANHVNSNFVMIRKPPACSSCGNDAFPHDRLCTSTHASRLKLELVSHPTCLQLVLQTTLPWFSNSYLYDGCLYVENYCRTATQKSGRLRRASADRLWTVMCRLIITLLIIFLSKTLCRHLDITPIV